LQQVVEEEVEALLGSPESARSTDEAPAGYRSGRRKPCQIGLMNGTITPRRPRVRGLEERFVSCILPPFQRHTP